MAENEGRPSRIRAFLSSITRRRVKLQIPYPQFGRPFWAFEELFGADDFGQGITGPLDAYQRVPIVRNAINTLAHFATRKGFRTAVETIKGVGDAQEMRRLKVIIDEVNRRVNLDLVLYIAVIKREIYGATGFEILWDSNDLPGRLLPMTTIPRPILDEDTLEIDYFDAPHSETGQLAPEDVLYFTRDALDYTMTVYSPVETVRSSIKLKRNLEKDLLESAKRLWAPIGLFTMDTSAILDPEQAKTELTEFSEQIKPGRSLVTNQKVEGKIWDLKPDLNSLVKAIETADQELMGNWNIPKALLSREKTLSKATLEYSLKALYEGPVASIQRYFKREIEDQFYDRIVANLNLSAKYRVRHVWKPVSLVDPALVQSYAIAVKAGAMNRVEFFNALGLEMIGPKVLPKEEQNQEAGSIDEIAGLIGESRRVEIQELQEALSDLQGKAGE